MTSFIRLLLLVSPLLICGQAKGREEPPEQGPEGGEAFEAVGDEGTVSSGGKGEAVDAADVSAVAGESSDVEDSDEQSGEEIRVPEGDETRAADPSPRSADYVARTPAAAAVADAESLLVLDVEVTGGLSLDVDTMTARIAEVVAAHAELRVSTMADIKDASLLAKSREVLGCEADQECLAQLTKALEADLVLSAAVGQIGTSVLLSLSLVDPDTASPIARSSETFSNAEELVARLPDSVGHLLGWSGAGEGVSYRLPEGKKVSFAVFDLKAAGVPEEVALNLTQVLSVEIKRIENTTVISRDDIMAMLQLEKERSILTCIDDTACIAEIGGALGVDKLVVGHVGKLASSYVVSLRLIDARSVEVNGRVSESFTGVEDQLIRAVRHAGRRLIGIETEIPGSLALASDRQEAEVFIDGQRVGELPMPPVDSLPAGMHTVRLSKDGFLDWQSDFFVDPGEATPMWVSLTEAPRPWYKKWWVWATVGGVLAVGGATAVYLLRPEPSTGSGQAYVGGTP